MLERANDVFRNALREKCATPLWDVLNALVTPFPAPIARPAAWSYGEMRPLLMRAGELISAREAERRVLILENPGLPGKSSVTDTLYAGLQLVLPGEIAPSHRHTQSALRFVLESDGAWTSVDGERVEMSPFDLVLTPSWRWHEHGNDGSGPAIWLDGLDIPIVAAFRAGFAEHLGNQPPPVRAEGDSRARYGTGLKPVRGTSTSSEDTRFPIFHYRYADWSVALRKVAAQSPIDPHFGCVMEFSNPADGGALSATISAQVQHLAERFSGRPLRQSASAVYVCVEGQVNVSVDGDIHVLKPRDLVAVPAWAEVKFAAGDGEAVLFSYSDRTSVEKLGFWREERS